MRQNCSSSDIVPNATGYLVAAIMDDDPEIDHDLDETRYPESAVPADAG